MENLSPRRKKVTKLPTPERMANIALHYLSRFAASEASLRRVLNNRIRRAALRDPVWANDPEKQKQIRNAIETIIEKHKKTGALNDTAYAEIKLRSLRRSGRSRRAIEQKLTAKGISKSIIEKTFSEDSEADHSTELKAAMTLARRRRFGPYRKEPTDADRHKKDMASMARAGFSYDVICKVLGGDNSDIEPF